MRKWVGFCVIALGFAGALALAPPDAIAQIAGTEHDLSGKAPGGQICIACHAPHKVPGTLLLWNHTLSANNFSWSDTTKTTGGTTLPANIKTWSGSTKNCLSCHDGSVDIGSIYVGGSFDPGTKMDAGHQIGTGGDLKGNHPVAVPYPYGGVKNSYNQSTTGDLALLSGWIATPVDVKLFTDPSFSTNNRGMECASCHDPHGTTNPDFLRAPLVGSAICLRCHAK